MKRKILLCLVTALSIVLALMPPMVTATTEYMEVAFQDTGTNEYIIENCTPPVTFKVDLKIHDVSDMWAWSCKFSWNKEVLNCTKKALGPFNSPGTLLMGVIDNEKGEIGKLASYQLAEETVSGSGVVCTLDFVAHHTGTSLINITDTNYKPLDQPKVYIDEVDGQFGCRAFVREVEPPRAQFTPETCTDYYLDTDVGFVEVEFNATSSVSGFDGDDVCPIEEYRWDFDGDCVFDENVSSLIISYNYTQIGDKNVTLEVFAPGIEDIDPGYIDTNRSSHIIHVVPAEVPPVPPVGSVIDLYTQKAPYSGKGTNQHSDAFAPGEAVVLFANVTYNGEPVANVQVGFEVKGPSAEPYVYRVNFTGKDGIATTSFRLGIEDAFGVWSAFASVEIAEQTVMDTLTFRFGWIVEIVSLVTVNKDLRPQGRFAWGTCVGVKLVLRNIAMVSKNATFTVIIQDQKGTIFPDKIILEDFVVKPGDTYFYIYCVLGLPEWASFGEAVVSASAFTAPPAEGGVPWCPEVSTSFLITWCDVAVVGVVPLVWEVEVGDIVEVRVHVSNEGDEVESFNVTLYYGSFSISEHNVTALGLGKRETLVFAWNTSGLAVGDYRLKAVASVVPGETDVEDNVFEDGVVRVVEMLRPPVPAVLPRELIVLLLISVGAVAFTGGLYLWYRKSEEMSGGGSAYEDGSYFRSFGSNPGNSCSSVKPRKSTSFRAREDDSYPSGRRERNSHPKFREARSLLQPQGSVSSGRSRNVSPAEFKEAISSLRRRKSFSVSDSRVFAVIRLPFVEEE